MWSWARIRFAYSGICDETSLRASCPLWGRRFALPRITASLIDTIQSLVDARLSPFASGSRKTGTQLPKVYYAGLFACSTMRPFSGTESIPLIAATNCTYTTYSLRILFSADLQ